jgi:hypothetical protein
MASYDLPTYSLDPESLFRISHKILAPDGNTLSPPWLTPRVLLLQRLIYPMDCTP